MLLCPSLPHNTGSQLRLTCKFCSLIYYIPSVQHNINVNINGAHINPLLVKIPVNTKLSYIFITSQSCEMISPWADFTWHCIGLTLALRLTNCQFCFVWLELQLSTRRVWQTLTDTWTHRRRRWKTRSTLTYKSITKQNVIFKMLVFLQSLMVKVSRYVVIQPASCRQPGVTCVFTSLANCGIFLPWLRRLHGGDTNLIIKWFMQGESRQFWWEKKVFVIFVASVRIFHSTPSDPSLQLGWSLHQ